MPMHKEHMMPGGKMMKGKMPAPMPPTAKKPATNPALAKLPEQAKAYGVRGAKPPTKGKK